MCVALVEVDKLATMYTLSRSHKGTAGMRSVLTFVKVVWIVDVSHFISEVAV
jgi:hypothetical protein